MIEPQLLNDSATKPGAWHFMRDRPAFGALIFFRVGFSLMRAAALGLERRATTRALRFYLTATRSADWTYVDLLGARAEFWMENG
ncbi:MAG: hypothetical protein U0892_05390 [Pirellulales bacterium]